MWYFLYNVLLILASPIILLILLAKKRCRGGLPQRLGFAFDEVGGKPAHGLPVIWVHAVSLGEVVAAAPLIRKVHAHRPDYRIIVTTVTETGREAVEQRLAGVAEHRYAPLDFPWVVGKVIDRLNPVLFLFVETELWPNLLEALSTRGVPTVLVNGRLSSKSFRGYRLIRPLIRRALRAVTWCLMQSDRDASRIRALGADARAVLQTGNIKFDQPLPDVAGAETLSRATLLSADEELIVAGSTHPGEEEQIVSCYDTLRHAVPSLVLLLAPRHIERVSQIEAVIRSKGLPVIRRSALGLHDRPDAPSSLAAEPRVILLDTRGELAAVYRHAVVSFVGGTLVPVGGHNLLEPALWGKAVLFGPYTDHCQEPAELLLDAGGARRVQNGEELAMTMADLLRNRPALDRMGQAARAVVMANRGALKRTLETIFSVLRSSKPVSAERDQAGDTNDVARRDVDSFVH